LRYMKEVNLCRCGRTNVGGRWAYREISDVLKTTFKIENYDQVLDELAHKRKHITLIGPDNQSEALKAKHEQCPICTRAQSGYFEGTLQLRNRDSGSYGKAVDIVESMVEGTKDAFISKIVELDDGQDFLLSSNNLLKKMGKALKDEFGGEIKESKSLFGQHRQTAKLLYRATILFRLPSFAPGDVLFVDRRPVYVRKISSRKVSGTDLSTGDPTSFPYHDPRDVYRDIKSVQITQHKPHVMVLDPDTYQPRKVESQWEIKGDEAKVIEIHGKLYLIPK
jgi:nonsense-mediated mRNA decay protein 3